MRIKLTVLTVWLCLLGWYFFSSKSEESSAQPKKEFSAQPKEKPTEPPKKESSGQPIKKPTEPPKIGEMALKIIESGLKGMVYDEQNPRLHALKADTLNPDNLYFSFVSQVPVNYPNSEKFNGQPLRRLTFSVVNTDGVRTLVLEQSHVSGKPTPVTRDTLASNLDIFMFLFWSPIVKDWIAEWPESNSLPNRVKVQMALKQADGSPATASDIFECEVVIP